MSSLDGGKHRTGTGAAICRFPATGTETHLAHRFRHRLVCDFLIAVNDNPPRDETYRTTLRGRTPEGELTTLIITRQGLGVAGRVWLTFQGAIRTTVVLTDEQVRRLADLLIGASEHSVDRGVDRGGHL